MRDLSRTMIGLLLGTAILIPSVAQAQDRGRDRGDRGGGERGFQGERGGQPRERAGGEMVTRERAIDQGRAAARDVERPQPVAQPRADNQGDARRQWQGGNRDWNRGNANGDGQSAVIARGRGDEARRRDNDDRQRDAARRDDNDRRNDGNQRWSSDRRDWNDRNDNNRTPDRATNRDGRNWDRSWTSDRNRWEGRGNDGRWDRNWRNDRRYSWQDYRTRNRQIYRLPRYNPPRWGYSYRRWSPGVRWDSWYYSQSYWIADPWFYRLPPAYGDYRWVRYYNDAILVDIRSGEIVDVIYSVFF